MWMEKKISFAMMIYRIDLARKENNQQALNDRAKANIAAKLGTTHFGGGFGTSITG